MSEQNKSQNMWSVVDAQNLGGVVANAASSQPGGSKEPFLNTTTGKVVLGAAAVAAGAGAMYLYSRSRQG
jgi:hypothetical protein